MLTNFTQNKIKLLWGHNPLNWLRFQWQLKSVQNGNNIIIVVAVVAVVVVRFFYLIAVVIIFQISWNTIFFDPKTNLAQKRCWYNKMLGQKCKVQQTLWSSKILITKKFYPKSFVKSGQKQLRYSWYGQMSPKQFWSKKMLCSKNLSETKFWAKKLRLSKNWAKKVWSKLGQ